MAVVTTNLGVITAYGDAVAAGYTGTKAEFQTAMANYAQGITNASEALTKANANLANTAETYSTSATYAVGDYVIYNNQLYRCTTAIATAESWTSGHWTAVNIADDVSQLNADITAKVSTVNGVAPDANGNVNVSGGGGISAEIKSALLQIAEKVAYIDAQGQTYYNDLYNALYALDHITAIFTQGSTVVYSNDTFDSLKRMLVVTAYYGDGTSAEVNDYTLSGTLTEGTSTITVTYLTKTATFNVTVTSASTSARIEEYGKLYGNDGIILTDGTENGAITVKYTMDAPSSVLYPAGIIPYADSLFSANKGAIVIK